MTNEVYSNTPEKTEELGVCIASCLSPGMVVALRGEVAAGKTCLVKGIARGLGIQDTITSPTYTILSEYQGTCPLYHIDAYRLNGDEDFINSGLEEFLTGDGIAVIEWSERIPASLPPDAITITIQIASSKNRIFHIEGLDCLNEQ